MRRAHKAGVASFCAVVLSMTSACSNDDDGGGSASRRGRGGDATTTTAPAHIAFGVTSVDHNGTRAPSDAAVASAVAVLDAYADAAIVTPLRTGQPPGDLSALFSPEALASLGDPAIRASVVEEGLSPAPLAVTATVANVNLSGVSFPDDVVAVMGARIDLQLHAVGPAAHVDIVRKGDLVLVPGPAPNSWVIDSFTLRTERHSRDAS